MLFIANEWKEYELIDTGEGERLERWGNFLLRRPDPQIIWPKTLSAKTWEKVHGYYHRNKEGGGSWEFFSKLPERWIIGYGNLSFYVRAMGFKHTGIFPEQASNWDWVVQKIQSRAETVRVLNLFAYTGGATLAAASAGAEVCHVDAAKGMVSLAKENLNLSGLGDHPVRFLVDDVTKYVLREERRGHTYEGIIMDPPSFGRGPNGEVWKLEEKLYELVCACIKILAPNPLFILINSYTTGLAPSVLQNVLALALAKDFSGKFSAAEVGLPITASGLVLPCGASCRWEAGK